MHHVAWSSPGSAPHSGHGSVSAGSKMAVRSRSLLRLRARASSNRRCRPFFTGQLPRRLRSAGKCIAGRTDRCPRWCAARGVPMYFLSRPRRKANSDVPYSRSCDRTVVANGRLLPDLPPVLRGEPALADRRPRRHRGPARPSRMARRGRSVDLPVLSVAPWPTSATTSATTATSIPSSATSPTSTSCWPGCHARDLKLLVDLVPNHTSDQHPWFQASRSSRDDPKRDWYIWRDGSPDTPPNNWRAAFVHTPAWTWDEATGQWYLHLFLPEQPDLNWANPEVVEAMHGVMRFWLDRGVDGFRIDVVHGLGKAPGLPDDPEGTTLPHATLNDTAENHEIIRGLRRVRRRLPGRPPDPRRGVPAGHRAGRHLLRPRATSCSSRSTSRRCTRRGRVAAGATSWPTPSAGSRRGAAGPPGSSPTTTTPATAPATGPRPGPGRRCSCCSGCGARRCCTRARRSGWRMPTIPPDRVVDPGGRDGCRAPVPWTGDARPRLGRDRPVAAVAAGARRPQRGRPGGRRRLDRAPLPAPAGGPQGVARPPARRPRPGGRRRTAWSRGAASAPRGGGDRVVAVNMGAEPAPARRGRSGRGVERRGGRGRAVRGNAGRRLGGADRALRGCADRRSGAAHAAPLRARAGSTDHGGRDGVRLSPAPTGPARSVRGGLVGAGLEHQAALAVEGQRRVALQQAPHRPPGDVGPPARQRGGTLPSPRTSASMSARVATSDGVEVGVPGQLADPRRRQRHRRAGRSSRRRRGAAATARPRAGRRRP